MTSESSERAPSSRFGSDLARRVRPRIGPRRRREVHRFVGVVGRSSLGFGQAVGRSSAIRPIVDATNLDSLSLRPPTGWWRDEPDELFAPDQPATPLAAVGRATRPTRSTTPSPPTWTQRLRAPGPHPAPATRRATAARRPAASEAPPAPEGFPTGDTKFDALRQMLAMGLTPKDSGAASYLPALPPRSDAVTPPGHEARPVRRSEARRDERPRPAEEAASAAGGEDGNEQAHEAEHEALSGRRGDTTAGVATAPGGFAARLRPEAIEPGVVARPRSARREASVARRSSADAPRRADLPGAASPGSSAAPSGGGEATSAPRATPPKSPGPRYDPTSPTSGRPGTRGPGARRPAPADRAEALRRMLAGGTPDAPSSRDAAGPRVVDSERDPGTGPASRASTDAVPASAAPARPSSRANSRVEPAPGDRARPSGAAPVARSSSDPLPRMRADTMPATASETLERSAPGSVALATRPLDTAAPAVGRDDPPAVRRSDQVTVAPTARPTIQSDEIRARRIVAAQRALRQRDDPGAPAPIVARTGDLAARPADTTAPALDEIDPSARPRPATVQPATVQPATVRPPTSLAPESHAVDSEVARAVPDVTTLGAPASKPPRRRPALGRRSPLVGRSDRVTSALADDVTAPGVVRRVTLPRALSTTHRPVPVRAHTADHALDTRPVGRTDELTRASIAPPSAAMSPTRDGWSDESRDVSDPAARASARSARSSAGRGPEPRGSAVRPGRSRLATEWSLVSPGSGALATALTGRARTEPSSSAPRSADRTSPTVRRAAATRANTRPSPRLGLVDSAAAAPGTATPGTAAPGAASPDPAAATNGEQLAERFMTELSKSVRRRPAPLPTPFRPMAEQIAGGRAVMLATDTASRRALRSVGKVAATTGDTIHLDPAATSAARMNEVLAHELTHVAHPSPAPRFFDDVVDSPEERRAEATARIMSRSPLAPAASILSAPGAPVRRASVDTIRRSDASTGSSPGTSPGTIDAASLAASISGGARPSVRRSTDTSGSGEVIRRLAIGSHRQSNQPAPAPTNQSSSNTTSSGTPDPEPTAFDPDSEDARRWFLEQLERHTSTIVRMLTDQIVIDLERRGGRLWGGI